MSTLPAFVSLRQLTALMIAHDVTRCVLCPGSRNSPIINMITQLKDQFSCRSACDERSAGFMALGWASQAQAPVAVIVTSGSALLNLHPAVAEAHYRQVPLLVISADRPAAWIGQQDGQTLPQLQVYQGLVRCSYQIPADAEGESKEALWHRNRLINEALLELRHRTPAPVHLNLSLAEPLWETSSAPLHTERMIQRTEFARISAKEQDTLCQEARDLPRRIILLGQSSLPPQLYDELHDKGFVIIGDSLSNAHQYLTSIAQIDLILDNTSAMNWTPDLLITCGGHIVSKRLKSFLRKNPPLAHWHVSPDGALIDTFCCLTRCLEGDADTLWNLLIQHLPQVDPGDASAQYHSRWYQADAQLSLPSVDEIAFSGLRVISELITQIPSPATLHLSNSLSVRLAQFYDLPRDVQVECNRGVNGIEGSLSTAIGYALGESYIANFLIIGDLSFFYDMNALSLLPLPKNLRILLINNGGGALFKALPTRPFIKESEHYIVAEHHHEAGGWARSVDVDYHAIYAIEDWESSLEALLVPVEMQKKPLLVEVFTEAAEDIDAFNHFLAMTQARSTPPPSTTKPHTSYDQNLDYYQGIRRNPL